MKKTMFITSVIMVVVMAIALTTSSLAWFSAAGSAQVTTSPLTIAAQANSSTGILISLDNDEFAENVTLASAPAMYPLVPLAGNATPTAALFQSALENDSFIGNKIATGLVIDPSLDALDENYNVAAQRTIFAKENGISGDAVAAYTSGFYTEEVYIANMATGTAGKTVYIEPSIAFKKWDATANAGAGAYVAYDFSNYAATHPIMYVAILADATDGNYEYASGGTAEEPAGWVADKASASTYDTDGDPETPEVYISREVNEWELVQVFSTASNAQDALSAYTGILNTTLAVGKTSAEFESGKVVNKSTAGVTPVLANSGKTSTMLAKAVDGATLGVAKHFKIVVWYDGASLNNNNSGWNFNFALTFTAVEPNA